MLTTLFSTLAPSTLFFFFNDTATTEIYTLSLHDALPISIGRIRSKAAGAEFFEAKAADATGARKAKLLYEAATLRWKDRKSTRLNSSHSSISYAVFCLKKKKKKNKNKTK